MAKDLEQTQGTFKLKGLVKGMERDKAYEEGIRPDGKNAGRTYRKLNIGVQTDPNNQVRLGLYSYEPEEVFMWNNDKRKKDPKYKGDRIPWEQYLEQKDILRANGSAVLQARAGVTYDEDGKLISEGMTNYEFAETVFENVDNDDSVYVEGDISHSEYKNSNTGELQTAVNYNLNRLHLAGQDFDFDDEKYEIQNYYEQEFVFVSSMIDKENEKLIVIGRTIDWNKNTVDSEFVVNYADDEDMKKLANSLHKKFKFGDLVKVFGELRNESIETEVEEEVDSGLAGLGGKAQPTYAKRANFTYIREMTILGVLAWDKKYYSEEDFFDNQLVVDEGEIEKEDDLTSELGGKSKPKSDNPFADDEEDSNDDFDPFADDSDPFSDDGDEIPF